MFLYVNGRRMILYVHIYCGNHQREDRML